MLKIINNIQSHPRLLLSDNTGWMDAKAKKLYTEGKKIKDKPKLSWLSQAAAAAAMAESPAVMTAAGWTPHSDGTIKLDSFGKPDRMQLADNLSAIGGTAVTAPLATSPTFITSMLGGTAVDGLSYATTGRSWGGNIEYLTNGVIPESVGAFTNIGYALGPKAFNNMYSESLRLPFMLKMIGKFGDKATRVDAMARFMGMLSPTTPVAEYLHGMIQLPKTTTPTIQSMLYWKPWRSSWKNGDSKGNMAESYYWSDYPNEVFEVVHDLEPGFHSVHFKTTQGTLPQDRKMGLFLAVANAIPEGEGLSTWGSLTPGGVHGLGRFGDLGFKLIGTRQLTMKNGLPINVPIWYKPLTFKPLTFKPENTRTFSPYKRKSKYPLSVQESLLDESLLETPVSEFDYSLPQKWVVDEHTGKTMLLSEYLKLYPNPEDVPWIDNYGEIVDKIQHNYENAMHRRRDYTFPYVGSNTDLPALHTFPIGDLLLSKKTSKIIEDLAIAKTKLPLDVTISDGLDMPLIKSNNWPTLKKPSEFEFNMNSYISQLPDYTGIFGNINGIKVPYIVDAYRHYLRNRGYQNYYISNENILKLLENLYKTLVKDLKGEAAKGKIFWNFGYTPRTTGHPERSAMYETVDLSKFSHGGMYFSRGKNYLPSSFSEYMDNAVDIRPFLIDNIDNITYNTKIVRNHPEHTLYVDPAEPYGRFDNMIWNNNDKFLLFYTTHTSGIKTIFPHPENLIKNEDGTFKIIRDWSDNRFGY